MVNKIPRDLVGEVLFSTAQEVFTSMLGTELTRQGDPDESIPQPFDGVMSFVGLIGDWIGTGFFICDSAIASDVASRFLMTSFESINDEVLDAVGEVTNIVMGSMKNRLEEDLGPLKMSTPTVVYGKNVSTRTMKNDLAMSVRCSYATGEVLFKVCLARMLTPCDGEQRARTGPIAIR